MEKAKRATIELGDRELDVFLLPDGSYEMSQAQVARAIHQGRQNASRFLKSKWLKSLPGIDSMRHENPLIEVETDGPGGSRVYPISLELAAIYWYYQSKRDNRDAEALVIACLTDSLLRRADEAFGRARTMDDYNQQLQTLEHNFRALSNSYMADDIARQNEKLAWVEVQRLQELLEENGINYRTE